MRLVVEQPEIINVKWHVCVGRAITYTSALESLEQAHREQVERKRS